MECINVVPRQAGTPKYQWLRRALLDHIDQHLSVGDPVPSERELADRFEISRMTARRVLTALESEGRVTREIGRGTFVAAPRIVMPIRMSSFTADMRDRGFTPGARTISFHRGAPEPDACAPLGLTPDDEVLRIVRLRTADSVPMAIEDVTLVAALVPGLSETDFTDTSLYEVLARRYGIVFDGGRQTLRATPVTDGESTLLEVPPQSSVMRCTRVSRWRGTPVEYTVSSYRGDRYELSSSL